MIRKILLGVAVVLLLAGMTGVAWASLITIGTATYNGSEYNLIYDSDMNIVWLDYTNDAAAWQDQVDWAAGLNASGVITYNLNPGIEISWTGDWRLPATVDGTWKYGYDGTTTGGYNITTSELGHLYYEELGNLGEVDTAGNRQASLMGLKNTGDFANLVEGLYWSGTPYSASDNYAWTFKTSTGLQGRNSMSSNYYGIAVRSATLVPIPGAVWLLGSGLLGLMGIRRRKASIRRDSE